MPNLSSSARLIAAGAGAAFMALLASPLAQADADLYTDISYIYGDALAYDNAYGPFEDAVLYSDLAQPYNIVAASGLDIGGPFPSGADASQDVSTIEAEGNTLVTQLTELHAAAATDAADFPEYPVIGDASAFQEQLNTAIADLPTITAQDETNPLLIADLSALYGNELDLSTYLSNLGDALAGNDPAGITADNASIIADALGFATDVQGASETLTILADLTSLGL
jgi:hypothetical protein